MQHHVTHRLYDNKSFFFPPLKFLSKVLGIHFVFISTLLFLTARVSFWPFSVWHYFPTHLHFKIPYFSILKFPDHIWQYKMLAVNYVNKYFLNITVNMYSDWLHILLYCQSYFPLTYWIHIIVLPKLFCLF